MRKPVVAAVLVALGLCGAAGVAPVHAQEGPMAGRWSLDRGLSQLPREIGFSADWLQTLPAGREAPGGGRGRGGAAPAIPRAVPRESQDDASRVRQLTDEVRSPSALLIIDETLTAITVTDDKGQARTFHPTGKEEDIQLAGVPVSVVARRDAGRLVVLYKAEPGRELRYTYTRTTTPQQLVVEVQFLERGGGDVVRRVYTPAVAAGTAPVAGVPSASAPAGATPEARLPAPVLTSRADAALRGITSLGLVVEDLSGAAVACGLDQASLESAAVAQLSGAGFKVRRNSDEDTYLYVNIETASPSAGLCVSRYDTTVYTHTTATLSYQDAPALVEVTLLHKGGITGGAGAAHAAGVQRGVRDAIDQFTARIRAANPR